MLYKSIPDAEKNYIEHLIKNYYVNIQRLSEQSIIYNQTIGSNLINFDVWFYNRTLIFNPYLGYITIYNDMYEDKLIIINHLKTNVAITIICNNIDTEQIIYELSIATNQCSEIAYSSIENGSNLIPSHNNCYLLLRFTPNSVNPQNIALNLSFPFYNTPIIVYYILNPNDGSILLQKV